MAADPDSGLGGEPGAAEVDCCALGVLSGMTVGAELDPLGATGPADGAVGVGVGVEEDSMACGVSLPAGAAKAGALPSPPSISNAMDMVASRVDTGLVFMYSL